MRFADLKPGDVFYVGECPEYVVTGSGRTLAGTRPSGYYRVTKVGECCAEVVPATHAEVEAAKAKRKETPK